MSDKIEINSTYIEELTILIENKNSSKLMEIIVGLHVADIAEIIEDLSDQNAKYFYDLIVNDEESAAVLIELEDNTRENLLQDLSAEKIAKEVIDKLATDDAADVIGELSIDKRN